MSFIKDDYAILYYLLVVGEKKGIKKVVIRHYKQISKLFRLDRIEIRTKFLLQTVLFHFIDIQ